MSRTCYIPTTIDSEIAIKLGWNPQTKQGAFTPYRVATLRGMYDDSHSEHLDTSDVEEASKKIASFRSELKKRTEEGVKSLGSNVIEAHRKLRASFTATERYDRVNMIANMISTLLDNVTKANPSRSRQEFLEGFEENGRTVGGQMAFFDKVYDTLLEWHSTYMAQENGVGREKADKIAKILDSWAALTTYTRVRLRDTEGIKLNNKFNILSEATLDNFSENQLSELIDMSESKREAWQEANDSISAFGSLGAVVRKIISTLPKVSFDSKGQAIVERDDLGFARTLDPVRTHQQLLDMLRGMVSSEDMIKKLQGKAQANPWITSLVKYLEGNPQAKTQFYVDFKKNFQLYSIIEVDRSKPISKYKTPILNRVRDRLSSSFNMRIANGNILSDDSVYNKDGSINWSNLQKTRQLIREWLAPKEKQSKQGGFVLKQYGKGGENKYWSTGGTYDQRRDFIVKTSRALGLEMDANTASVLMSNKKDLSAYLRNLYDLVEHGIDPALGAETVRTLENGGSLETRSYKSLFKATTNAIASKEKIGKLNNIITKYREGNKVESRVVRRDSKGNSVTYFSSTNPCYMGDKFELISSYIANNDKQGLKTFIEQEYFTSSYFVYNGKVLNKWLEDMYNACSDTKPLSETLGEVFSYKRFLGATDFNFEDMTSKQHIIDVLYEFSSDREISPNANTAWYPVFILGDSGVSKYIKQKRYTTDEIVDYLWDVYQQEHRRMALVEDANRYLQEKGELDHSYESDGTVVKGKGYSPIANYSESAGRYTFLPFLNEIKLEENATKEEVKAAIRSHLDSKVSSFITQLQNLGVLETVEITENGKKVQKYKHLDQFLDDVENGKRVKRGLTDALRDFYYNYKFATIEQLQLMTIDPAFYKGTKDLQKRYKEIHAPGSVLDLQAVNPFTGNLFSEDGIETCLYFQDIELNAEELNSEFMELMKRLYVEKPKVYDSYKKSSLTDGQGYRSLTSYRKVLGMAGQWTAEMERAYNQIMNMRTLYGKNPIPKEELRKIEELAVIFRPLKPYMFTHEQLSVGSDRQIIPVQHKYAEAVLIPELLPQGSKLRDMAYYMEEHNIDLIGSTTICKVGAFGVTKIDHLDSYKQALLDRRKAQGDNNGNVSNTELLNFALSQGYVHQLSYNDYRIQTNVPDHVHQARLFGTQVRKLIMAGVMKYKNGKLVDEMTPDGHYKYEKYVDNNQVNLGGRTGFVRLNSRNLIAFYNGLIVANQLDSYHKFEKAVANPKDVSERLTQSIIGNSRESLDNLYALSIENGDFAMPLFEGGMEHDTSSMLLSLFKKLVNKQTINGGAGVQVSSMGIKDYSEDGGLHYILSEDGKNVLYAEAEIPFNLSYTDRNGNTVELDYDTYCNDGSNGTVEGSLKMKGDKPLIEWDFPGITEMVAYRIPTERDYSMINIRVVRFSRKTAGGTIKVPLQGTTISGFDFDIDKLYFMRKEFVATKENDDAVNKLLSDIFGSNSVQFQEYDYSKPPLENTRAARNNMLLHLIQQRLMDEETLEARTTPGGFPNASRSARKLRELFYGNLSGIVSNGHVNWDALDERANDKKSDPEPNYDPTDPMTLILYNQQNQVAGKLIGIFANQNTNHALAGLFKKFQLQPSSVIEFAGHTVHDGFGFDLIHSPQGRDIDLTLAEFLAASVDAVKDPVLNFLNFNTLTADTGALLARLGYNTLEIGLLLNQPIIKEVCEHTFNNSLNLETAISEVFDSYSKKFGIREDTLKDKNTSVDAMASHIIQNRNNPSSMSTQAFVADQLAFLDLFRRAAKIASEVGQFVTNTKFTASNAVSSNFGDMYAQQMKMNNYVENLYSGTASLVIEVTDTPVVETYPMRNDLDENLSDADYMDALVYNPLGYEQAMYDLNKRAINKLSKYFPYNTTMYASVRDHMANLTAGRYIDGATINSIHRDLLVYLMSKQEGSDFNGTSLVDTKYGTISNREYYTKYFAKDLFDHLQANPWMKNMSVFEYLMFDENDGVTTMNIQGVGGLIPYQKEEIKESWAELNAKFPRIAKDLFLYNFYKLGFDFSPLTFMNLAPFELKQSLTVTEGKSYFDFLKEVLGGKYTINLDEFAQQYILNHPDDTRFIYKVRNPELKSAIKKIAQEVSEYQNSFTVDLTKDDFSPLVLRANKENKIWAARPAILIEGHLYLANSSDSFTFNLCRGVITYTKADFVGSKSSKAYGSLETPAVSERVSREEAPTGNTTMQSGQFEDSTSFNDDKNNFDRKAALSYIVDELNKALQSMGKEMAFEADSFMESTNDQLFEMVANIRKACRKDGVLMLDSEGNLMQGC